MFKLNKKGFTLVELLAVIVVLAIILVIAIPNVLGIIDNSRKDSFISTAKMIVDAAKTSIASNSNIAVPVKTDGSDAIVLLVNGAGANSLKVDNMTKDVDGGSYTTANCWVLIYRDGSSVLQYYITLDGSARDMNYVNAATTLANNTTARAAINAASSSGTDYAATPAGAYAQAAARTATGVGGLVVANTY